MSTTKNKRLTRGKERDVASFPVAPDKIELPATYTDLLQEIKVAILSSLAYHAAMEAPMRFEPPHETATSHSHPIEQILMRQSFLRLTGMGICV
jgi:hypothetical protein